MSPSTNPTWTMSPGNDKYKMPGSPPVSPTQSLVYSKLECDYDKNPTILYEAIEAKQWDYAINLFKKDKVGDQASTWVVRKETNGKLRWRILPLHAAVIFGSPVKLVECLLHDYPEAAQCKDDQGMLPLHLCFRNESTWDIADELLTSYPQAIFVSDRKGRTPLQCALQMASSSQSIGSIDLNRPESLAFRSVVNVLDLYSQAAISAERQKAHHDSRRAAESRIAHLQESHLSTLNNLKQNWHRQQEDSRRQTAKLTNENRQLQDKLKAQELELAISHQTEQTLRDQLLRLEGTSPTHARALMNSTFPKSCLKKDTSVAVPTNQTPEQIMSVHRTNDVLRSMVADMVSQHKQYHEQFSDLMNKYETLANERKELEKIFVSKTQTQHKKEAKVIHNFRSWMEQQQKSLDDHSTMLEQEEKKVDDVMETLQRMKMTGDNQKDNNTPTPPSIATTESSNNMSAIIDVSNLPSPTEA